MARLGGGSPLSAGECRSRHRMRADVLDARVACLGFYEIAVSMTKCRPRLTSQFNCLRRERGGTAGSRRLISTSSGEPEAVRIGLQLFPTSTKRMFPMALTRPIVPRHGTTDATPRARNLVDLSEGLSGRGARSRAWARGADSPRVLRCPGCGEVRRYELGTMSAAYSRSVFFHAQGSPVLNGLGPLIELFYVESPATQYPKRAGNRLFASHSVDCPRRDAQVFRKFANS
jgi:hypothetical protein